MTLSAKPVSLVKKTDIQRNRQSYFRLNNNFLRDRARFMVVLKFQQYLTVILLCILFGLLFGVVSTNYRVFATSNNGTLVPNPPIDQEVQESTLMTWVVTTVLEASTIGFFDYELRFQQLRSAFTDQGWESYNRFLRTSFNKKTSVRAELENGHILLQPKITTPPQILRRGLVGGVMTYHIQLEITIRSVWSEDMRIPKTLDLIVERVTPEINSDGLAISQWRIS